MQEATILPIIDSIIHLQSLSTTINDLIRQFFSCTKEERINLEKQVQLALNRGEIIFPEDLQSLQSAGYTISYNPKTIARFQDFVFPQQSELTEAIRSATPTGGLLLDSYKSYRPGLASVESGAAKGYDEIFSIFEKQTTEKESIGKDTNYFLRRLAEHLPPGHPWIQTSSKTILDLGCGNGVQSQKICNPEWKLIGLDNQASCIDNSRKLLADQQFEVYDIFLPPPDHLQKKADVAFVSHFYCRPEDAWKVVENLRDYRSSNDTVVIFIHGCEGTDADRLYNEHAFLCGKPSSDMTQEFKKALKSKGYDFIESICEAKLDFPPIAGRIRTFLLNIKRGDYENPYLGIDLDTKVFKALMEFIASCPLEGMTQEQILMYLEGLENTFEKNGASYLKICNKMVIAYPQKASFIFQKAIEKTLEVDENQLLEIVTDQCNHYFFKEAKETTAKLLRKNPQEPRFFTLMADVCLKNQEYPEATALLQYAKRLGADVDPQIENIEMALLQKYSKQKGVCRGMQQAVLDKEQLKNLRDKIREQYVVTSLLQSFSLEKAQALRKLYQDISCHLRLYIENLSQDVVNQLKSWGHHPPCEYALLGLGSLAREEMTPYSDFEFAILIDSEKFKDYFRLFSQLLHLRFINLGETIIPSLDIQALDWFYDDLMPRGLSFDGSMPTACKFPLGKQKARKGDYELIHTPDQMAKLQKIQASDYDERLWILKRYHLPTILSNVGFITGSEQGLKLTHEYQKQVFSILQAKGKKRALDLMEQDLVQFKPRLEEAENGKHYNVKKDLYRLPNTMFDGLANYFCLKSQSSWERIEELENLKVFSPKGAKNLKIFAMEAQELRLCTYFKHNKQKDHLDLDDQRETIHEMYYTSLGLAKEMRTFCLQMKEEQDDPVAHLKEATFSEKNSYHIALIYLRHMEFLQAERAFAQQEHLDFNYYQDLASLKNLLGKYSEAEKAYQKAIAFKPASQLYDKLAKVLQAAARYPEAEEAFLEALKKIHQDHEEVLEQKIIPTDIPSFDQIIKQYWKAKKSFQQQESLEPQYKFIQKGKVKRIDQALLQFERVYLSLTRFYKEIGDFNKTRHCLKQCQIICKRRPKPSKDLEYQAILDLDLAELKKTEAHLKGYFDSQFDEERRLILEVKQIFNGYYRREDHPKVFDCEALLGCNQERKLEILFLRKKIFGERHPSIASSYIWIGNSFSELGNYQEALENQVKALNLRKDLLGEKHPDVAASYNNVSSILSDLGRYEEALKINMQALDIVKAIFGEKHPHVATSYNNVGLALNDLGRYKEALKMQEQSLGLYKALFGEEHPHVATSYSNVGLILNSLGRYEEAYEKQMHALELYKAILGEKHLNVAISYDNIGTTLISLNKHKEALKVQRQALDLRRAFLGGIIPKWLFPMAI